MSGGWSSVEWLIRVGSVTWEYRRDEGHGCDQEDTGVRRVIQVETRYLGLESRGELSLDRRQVWFGVSGRKAA